jgi:hypothetical protein
MITQFLLAHPVVCFAAAFAILIYSWIGNWHLRQP